MDALSGQVRIMIDKNELVKKLQYLSIYNAPCPHWVYSAIINTPDKSDTYIKEEIQMNGRDRKAFLKEKFKDRNFERELINTSNYPPSGYISSHEEDFIEWLLSEAVEKLNLKGDAK